MNQDPFATLTLGICLVAVSFTAWIGFGALIARALRLEEEQPVWLLAALGVSALMPAGGAFALFNMVSAWMNNAILAAGFLAGLHYLHSKRNNFIPRLRNRTAGDNLALAIRVAALTLLALRVSSSIFPYWLNINDDWMTYFHFPKRMLATGSFIEPFNLRRLAYLGGAPYLQSFLFPFLKPHPSLAVTDMGLGSLLFYLAALGPKGPESGTVQKLGRELVGLLAVVFTFGFVHESNAPLALPMALMLIMMRAAGRGNLEWNRGNIWTLAVLSAGLVSIRNNYVVFPVVFLGMGILFGGRKNLVSGLKTVTAAGVLAVLLLIPWMLVSYRSNLTPFFPVIKGTYTYPFGFSENLGPAGTIVFIWDNINANLFYLFAIIAAALPFAREGKKEAVLAITSCLIIIALLCMSLTASDTYGLKRYLQPFTLSTAAYVFSIILAQYKDRADLKRQSVLAGAAVIFLALWYSITSTYMLKDTKIRYINNTNTYVTAGNVKASAIYVQAGLKNSIPDREGPRIDYERMQDFMQPGSKVLSMVDHAHKWDFTRHEIDMVDCIGQVSPRPGMPFFKGSAALAGYLKGLGYRYIAYIDFNTYNGLYWLPTWQKRMDESEAPIWKSWSYFFVDFFQNLGELEAMGLVAFRSGNFKVIDLSLMK